MSVYFLVDFFVVVVVCIFLSPKTEENSRVKSENMPASILVCESENLRMHAYRYDECVDSVRKAFSGSVFPCVMSENEHEHYCKKSMKWVLVFLLQFD